MPRNSEALNVNADVISWEAAWSVRSGNWLPTFIDAGIRSAVSLLGCLMRAYEAMSRLVSGRIWTLSLSAALV